MHTTWTDGKYSCEEMVEAARKRGLKYVAITDHSKSLGVAGGLSDEDLIRHTDEIRALDAKFSDIRVLAGTEVDIRKDGSLDYSDELLAKLDFVVASVHGGFNMDRDAMTARVVKAIQNPHCRKAREMDVHVVINTDSHDYDGFDGLPYGVATAQRGWIEKDRVLNSRPVEELLGFKG
jgi:DNA polymerase (family 10)